jgi:hypothetical protein
MKARGLNHIKSNPMIRMKRISLPARKIGNTTNICSEMHDGIRSSNDLPRNLRIPKISVFPPKQSWLNS